MLQREGSHHRLGHSAVARGPERAELVRENPLLNETGGGAGDAQRRVNLLPLEEGPFGEGEENNLYEEHERQRAIPEKKLPCCGWKDDLS